MSCFSNMFCVAFSMRFVPSLMRDTRSSISISSFSFLTLVNENGGRGDTRGLPGNTKKSEQLIWESNFPFCLSD